MTGRAVFIDRDGVINHHWFNPATGAWESPIHAADFRLRTGVREALRALQAMGYHLFLVSNQPSAAKGKCTLEDLAGVHDAFLAALDGIAFRDYFYSYSHPKGIVAALDRDHHMRKPNPYFIDTAVARYGLDRRASWMLGDRDTDIEFGRNGGLRTIQIVSSEPDGKAGMEKPDFRAADLGEAARIIAANG
jgi:D-glycero-D-manno-heptose 1,7-bisphosphate phosphatase